MTTEARGPTATYEVHDGVAWLTMDRPEARHALDRQLRDELFEGFARFAADPVAHVLVLTATGDAAFCAGGDLKEMAATSLEVPGAGFLPILGHNVHVDKPVIAAVNGVAYAGGFLLAQMCDLCVAADHATFAITEARWGRGAPWAAPLPWLIPPRVALELLLTAEPIDAERARSIGLVNRVVPGAELRSTVDAMARTIAANAPLSVRASKAMVYASVGASLAAARSIGDELFEPVYRSADAQEGPRAFRERRQPHWRAG